eukprot:m.929319 g.929319  ORF g.929319 m.929319 type:complete len:76 (-) comp23781_c0_seq22:2818-3045(-)
MHSLLRKSLRLELGKDMTENAHLNIKILFCCLMITHELFRSQIQQHANSQILVTHEAGTIDKKSHRAQSDHLIQN